MACKVKFTNKAITDLSNIWEYTFDNCSECQADKYYYDLIKGCNYLSENPFFGKKYPEINSDIYGILIQKHIIFYQISTEKEILIIRILHASSDLKHRITE